MLNRFLPTEDALNIMTCDLKALVNQASCEKRRGPGDSVCLCIGNALANAEQSSGAVNVRLMDLLMTTAAKAVKCPKAMTLLGHLLVHLSRAVDDNPH